MTDYRVHNVHMTVADHPAVMQDGTKVLAQVPTALIELVPADGHGESRTVRRRIDTPERRAEVEAVFIKDAKVRSGGYTLVKETEQT